MNETDIKKCIKNGYCWSSYGDHPTKRHIDADTMRNVLSGNKSRHATKRESQAAIAARKANSVKGTFMSQFSMAERKMLMPDCEFDEYGKTHTAAETEAELVRRSESKLKAAYAALDKAKTEAGDKPSPTETVKPTREQQIADGWTDEEIKRAAFQPREWTDIPQPLAPRKPTLAECVDVFKSAAGEFIAGKLVDPDFDGADYTGLAKFVQTLDWARNLIEGRAE